MDPAQAQGEWRPDIATQDRRSLLRLRWQLRAAALSGVALWGVYQLLVARATFADVGLNVIWWASLGLLLIQLGFRVAFPLYDRNAALWSEMQKQLVQAHDLSEVSHAMSVKLAPEDLLPYLAENLVRIVDATHCAIVLRNPYSGEVQPMAVFRVDGATNETSLVDDDLVALAQTVIQKGQLSTHSAVGPSPRARSMLGLPLWGRGGVIGAAIVGDVREQHEFAPDAIRQAMVVANQGAVAIANAQLFREVEQRLVELGTLAEISRVIGSLLDPADIYRRVVDELARAFGYPFVAFFRMDERRQVLELGAQVGYDAERLPVRIDIGQSFVGQAAATGQTVYVPDCADSPGELVDPGMSARRQTFADGIVSQIAAPLFKDDRCLGVLSIESYHPLTEADLSLLQSLSYQVGAAIENARLYAAEQRERQLAHTLLQIASDLSGTLQLDKVLNLILERLRAVLPYESAAIGLLSGDVCYLAAAHDLPRAQRLWGAHISPEALPFVARVLRERAAVVLADTRRAPDWVNIEGSENIRSWLGVPLAVKDRTIGLLMLNHDTPDFYDQEAAQLTLAFAQHAALALDNARLYEQTQAKLREQMLLYETTATLSSILDAGQILRILAERLTMALGGTSTYIVTVDEEMENATLVAQHVGPDATSSAQIARLGEVYWLTDMPVSLAALAERRPLMIIAGEEPPEWRPRMEAREGQAMLLLPLAARDRLAGFVELWDSRSRRRFTDAEIALAQTMIHPAAVAIENARLFAETQRSINELILLFDTAVWAASSQELDTILQSVVKTLQFRVLQGAAVTIWLLDAPTQQLELRARAGELAGLTLPNFVELESQLGQVVRSGESILIGDTAQRDLENPGALKDPKAEGCAEFGPPVRSVLCAPLATGHQVIGVLQALSAQPGAFSGRDLRLLRTMAGSLAIGIQNIRLVADLRRSEDALTLRNQALERANDRLQELDRLKSAFVASVSHELRTPLNSIIGFSEVLMDGLAGELQPSAQEYLNFIHGSGKHLLSLINDILDLSRLQAGRMTLSLESVDVVEVINDVCASLSPLIAGKRQILTLEQPAPLPAIVADEFRLRQILINLVGNANKFTPQGGQITLRVFLVDPVTLRLDVNDNGPGISLDDQRLIFEEFRQARTTHPGEGTGLGLAITRRLVELHGGRIWVESQVGMGAMFTILLPVGGPVAQDQPGVADG